MADNSTPTGGPVNKGPRSSSGDVCCMPRLSTLIFLRQYARIVRVSPVLPEPLRSFFAN